MFTYHNNGSDLEHLGDFIAPEVANQNAAFLGLILKWHPWHSSKKIDSAQESGKSLKQIHYLKCPAIRSIGQKHRPNPASTLAQTDSMHAACLNGEFRSLNTHGSLSRQGADPCK